MYNTNIEIPYLGEVYTMKQWTSKMLSNISDAAAIISGISREVPKIQIDTYDQHRDVLSREEDDQIALRDDGENLNIMKNELLRFGGVNVSLGWFCGVEKHLGIRKIIFVNRKVLE